MLHEQIKNEIKQAMLGRDELKLRVVRSLVAAFTNELVAKRRKPAELLTDEEVLAVITRAAKQRKDSIEQFRAGNREDLAGQEEAELKMIETYLPKLMNQDEIRPLALAKKAELGVIDKTKAGQLMSALMKDLKGRADGADVKTIVDELLA
ncbi:MAG: GatB/YqeY domain-containing protein [Patescibacteria group bacterium]